MNNNNSPNFIGITNMDNNICKNIINLYHNSKESHLPGRAGGKVDHKIKNSTDLSINPKEINNPGYECLKDYFNELNKSYQDYIKTWSILAESFPMVDIGQFNIQKYETGGHFSKLHFERGSLYNLHRLFAFMTYLNDDFEGGHTFFSHYDISIKPETGKTLIWPAEWTHAHRGEVIKSNSKYIITGWFNIPHPSI
jgi:prolyl 4-hydroxylase